MTGRAGPGPSDRICTPGWYCSVAPMVSCSSRWSSSFDSTEVGWNDSNCGRGLGLTDNTSAKWRSRSTSRSSVAADAPMVTSVRRLL